MKHCEDNCQDWEISHKNYFGLDSGGSFCLIGKEGNVTSWNYAVCKCPWCGARLIDDKKPDKTQEYLRLHYEMWDWLAENPERSRDEWLSKQKIWPSHNCFLCSLYKEQPGNVCNKNCPLELANNSCGNLSKNWLSKWRSGDYEDMPKYARKIRDVVLPYLDKPVEEKESILDTWIKYLDEGQDGGTYDKDELEAWNNVNNRIKALEDK